MDDSCIIYEKSTGSRDSAAVGDKGLQSLQQCSKNRNDNLHLRWQGLRRPLKVHITCRKTYTRPSTIAKAKRKQEEQTDDNQENPPKLRSRTPVFSIKDDCLYCCKPIKRDKNRYKETLSRSVETLDYLHNVIEKADKRGDVWGSEVKLGI